jgi:hypothetical protein
MCFKPTIHEPFVAVAKPTGRSSKIQLGGIDDRLIGTFRKLVSGPKLETGKRDNKKSEEVVSGPKLETGKRDNKKSEEVVSGPKLETEQKNDTISNEVVSGPVLETVEIDNKNSKEVIPEIITAQKTFNQEVTSDNPTSNIIGTNQNSSNKQGKIDIEYKPTTTATPTEKESKPIPIRKEYKDLVLTDVQIKELDSVFKLNVIIEEPKSEMVYEEYLKAYSTPLLGMVETKTQETLGSDIVVTGNLNIFLIFTSETENNVSDELIDSTISSLQKAVDEVFAKLYGYNNFPNKIKVNIFEIAYTTTITLTTNKTAIRNTKYKDEDHLANILEVCHYSTKPKCTPTHHLVIIYDVSATKNTVFDHEVTHATVAVSSDSNHYKKIVFSMTGALYLCDLPNISLKDEDAAFVKATCSADIEGNLQLTDMDAAYLRRIWDIQTKPITAVPDTLPVSQLET